MKIWRIWKTIDLEALNVDDESINHNIKYNLRSRNMHQII